MKSKKTVRRQRTKKGEVPKILHRKDRNLAYISLDGVRFYLGYYDGKTLSPEIEAERLRIWKEYQARGGHDPGDEKVTVAILVERFLKHAKDYYQKNGRQTGSYDRFVLTLRVLYELYADCPAEEFSPTCLMAVRDAIVETGISRKTVNTRIGLVRHVFKWGSGNGLCSVIAWQSLRSVADLKKGRSPAPERSRVKFVRDDVVEATLPLCPPAVQTMVRLQRTIGMRPGEVCSMRPCDI